MKLYFTPTASNGTNIKYSLSQAKYALGIPLITTPLYICHIVTILMKKKLHQNVYYILINLIFSDMLFNFFIIRGSSVEVSWAYFQGFEPVRVFSVSSVLFTLCVTLDRYIKVEYCLRYHAIATKRRLVYLIAFVWVFSITFSFASQVNSAEANSNLIGVMCNQGFLSICSLVLLVSSAWVRYVRNKHLNNITKMNRYFGIQAETLDILKSLGKVVKELIQLSFVTAILVLGFTVTRGFQYYFGIQVIGWMYYLTKQMYLISNPFIYMFVMTDMRKCYATYYTAFKRWLHRRPSPEI